MAIDIEKYHVDFTEWLDRDQSANAIASSLDQFRDKNVYGQVLQAFVDEANEAYQAIVNLGKTRNIAFASGIWLDGIGRIVGQKRENTPTGVPDNWWYMDSDAPADPQVLPEASYMDNHLSYVTNGDVTSGYPSDSDYRDQIVRRIFQNINKGSTIPELQAAMLAVLGVDVKIEQTSIKTIKLYVPVNTPEWIKYYLTGKSFAYDDETTGAQYYNRWYFPFPAGISVESEVGEYT